MVWRHVNRALVITLVLSLCLFVGCSRYAKDDPLKGIKTYRDALQMFNNYTEVYVSHMEAMSVDSRAPIVKEMNPIVRDVNAALGAWGAIELSGGDPSAQVVAFNAAWARFWGALLRYKIVEVK